MKHKRKNPIREKGGGFISNQHGKHRHVSKNTLTYSRRTDPDAKTGKPLKPISGTSLIHHNPLRQEKKRLMREIGIRSGKRFRKIIRNQRREKKRHDFEKAFEDARQRELNESQSHQ